MLSRAATVEVQGGDPLVVEVILPAEGMVDNRDPVELGRHGVSCGLAVSDTVMTRALAVILAPL